MNCLSNNIQGIIFTYLPIEEVYKSIAFISKAFSIIVKQYLKYSNKINVRLGSFALLKHEYINLLRLNLLISKINEIIPIEIHAPRLKKLKLNFTTNLPNFILLNKLIRFISLTQLEHFTIRNNTLIKSCYNYEPWIRKIKKKCPNLKKFKMLDEGDEFLFVYMVDGVKYISNTRRGLATIRKWHMTANIREYYTMQENLTKIIIKESYRRTQQYDFYSFFSSYFGSNPLPKSMKSLTIQVANTPVPKNVSFEYFKDFPKLKSINGVFSGDKNYIKYTKSTLSIIKMLLYEKFRLGITNIKNIKYKTSKGNAYSNIYNLALSCLILNPYAVEVILSNGYISDFGPCELAYFVLCIKAELHIENEQEKTLLYIGKQYTSPITSINLNEIPFVESVLKNIIEGKQEITITKGKIYSRINECNFTFCRVLKLIDIDFIDNSFSCLMHSIKNMNLTDFEIQSSTLISNRDYFSFLKIFSKKKSTENLIIYLKTTRITFTDYMFVIKVIERLFENTLITLKKISINIPVDENDELALSMMNELVSRINSRVWNLQSLEIFFEENLVICELYKSFQDYKTD